MTTETTAGISLQTFGDAAFRALGAAQDSIKLRCGVRDGGGTSIVESCHHTVTMNDGGTVRLELTVELTLPEAGDLSWMAFKACSYALFTVCREQLRPMLVWEGTRRRIIPAGSAVDAQMNVGEARMRVTVVVPAGIV
jgi:hypothetical protein